MPPGCTADFSRRYRLRAATSTAHIRLDALVEAGAFLKRRDIYLDYLHSTYRARAAVEAGLDAAGVEQIYAAWPGRLVATDLARDIADLDPAATPRRGDPVHFTSAPAVLGGLYVLEGSALGARLLASRAATIGMTRDFGGRHMWAQTRDPTAWRRFVATLDNLAMTETEEIDCIAGAKAVFACFERELSALGEPA